MRPLVPAVFRLQTRLQTRLLALLVVAVAVALGTVAIVARASATMEFERYLQDSRQDMQIVARKTAASTGDRLLVPGTQGKVLIDSSGELVGQTLTSEQASQLGVAIPPPPIAGTFSAASFDVMFVRRQQSTSTIPTDGD